MTRNELYELLQKCGWGIEDEIDFQEIWGQPFDGETEKIKPTTEESSATLSEPLFEEHPRKMDEEYDEDEHRRL